MIYNPSTTKKTLYKWGKYNANESYRRYYEEGDSKFVSHHNGTIEAFRDYFFNSSTGNYTTGDILETIGTSSNPGTVYNWTSGYKTLIIYTSDDTGYNQYTQSSVSRSYLVHSKGDFVEYITSESSDTYPQNDYNSDDGYWYVYVGEATIFI